MSVYDLGKRRRRAVRPSPLFLAFVAVTVLGACDRLDADAARIRASATSACFLFVLGGWIVSVCLHEFAHAYAAYRAGDRSVEAAGT